MKVDIRPPLAHPPSHPRDATGHLDSRVAADLRARSKASAGPADPPEILERDLRDDPFAEGLGEAFVRNITGGEDEQDDLDQVAEEIGGHVIEATGDQELAYDTDPSNPEYPAR